MKPSRWATAVLVTAALTVAGCGSTSAGSTTGGNVHIVASFYPLQWMSQQVAGTTATVDSLTKPGAEPHDLELTPQDVAKVADADLVVYLKGFQPSVEEAVAREAGDAGYDVAPTARLDLTYTPIEEGQQHAEEKGAIDPHFWLDPVRFSAVARGLADRLAQLNPSKAMLYRTNAESLVTKLTTLDKEFTTGLAQCANKDLVTSHNAFGYLSQRYGMTQVGITGLTPEDEPKPADLATIASFVRKNKVRTIYYETLVSPAIAQTVASETGATTAVLDPIEGLTSESRGSDYLQVMRSNLASIRKGQPCT